MRLITGCIDHRHIHRPHGLFNGMHHLIDLLFICDIRLEEFGLTAQLIKALTGRQRLFLIVVIIDGNLGTGLPQRTCHGKPQSLGTSGNQRHFAFQRKSIDMVCHDVNPMVAKVIDGCNISSRFYPNNREEKSCFDSCARFRAN